MTKCLPLFCLAAAFAQGPQSGSPAHARLNYPPLNALRLPEIERAELPNGLQLRLIEDHELPMIYGVALIRTGTLFAPADKRGVAALTGAVLRTGGTGKQPAEEFDGRLESLGAAVESSIGETRGTVTFSAAAEHAGDVLQAVRDMLAAPAFGAENIALAKAEIRSGIARRNDEPARVAVREFISLIYGRDTPYGAVLEYRDVDRIGREDMQAFHRRHFFPANIILGLRGDFEFVAMRAKVEAVFGDWQNTQPSVPAFPPVDHAADPGIYHAERKGQPGAYFAVGHVGGRWSDPDFPALRVGAEILGGGLTSRLALRIRMQTRASYPISAEWAGDYTHPGTFLISGQVNGISTPQTIRAIREEIERMQSGEVSESELEYGSRRVLNDLAWAFDTKAESLERLLVLEYYGYPPGFIDRYQKAVAAVTRADVLNAARKRFHPDRLVAVVAGDPRDYGTSLATLGLPVTSLDLTIPSSEPLLSEATPESLQRGREALQLAQAAAGGAEKLEGILDVTETALVSVDPAFGGPSVKRTKRWVSPAYLRQDNELPAGRVSTFWTGKAGWIANAQGAGPLPPSAKKQAEGEVFRVFFRLLLSDRIEGRVVNAADGAVEISDEAGNFVKLIMDESSGLPREARYTRLQPDGAPVHVRETFDAFHEVGGIKMPSRRTIEQDGRRFGEVVVQEHRLNTGLKPAELGRWR
jgi:zinc protease